MELHNFIDKPIGMGAYNDLTTAKKMFICSRKLERNDTAPAGKKIELSLRMQITTASSIKNEEDIEMSEVIGFKIVGVTEQGLAYIEELNADTTVKGKVTEFFDEFNEVCDKANNSGAEDTTGKLEVTSTEQTMETREVEMQEAEPKETTGNVEETENYDNYEELVSVPVDGRDGSIEKPYQVGDTIYFPKVLVAAIMDIEGDKILSSPVFAPMTMVVEEATPEYVKISYKFGVDNWADLDWENWSSVGLDMSNMLVPFRVNSELEQIGTQLIISDSFDNRSDVLIHEEDETEFTFYYQDFDGVGYTEDTEYLNLVYTYFSIPYEECYPYFNCTFIEVPKS